MRVRSNNANTAGLWMFRCPAIARGIGGPCLSRRKSAGRTGGGIGTGDTASLRRQLPKFASLRTFSYCPPLEILAGHGQRVDLLQSSSKFSGRAAQLPPCCLCLCVCDVGSTPRHPFIAPAPPQLAAQLEGFQLSLEYFSDYVKVR